MIDTDKILKGLGLDRLAKEQERDEKGRFGSGSNSSTSSSEHQVNMQRADGAIRGVRIQASSPKEARSKAEKENPGFKAYEIERK